ncbi:helix-turn-helix domain-containing protein [Pseudomonas nitroreducens]|uniref:Helix-turn-helix domain-containing protein n=1 Tax=Pseudomonas nitroreducens TaxID=46680 RepID=A0A6G6IUZ4_PSENT|nr:helix-turn-helix domain-containing protein [Pseudomonas nitroreducens]QIE86763.1 helix-turn-helix domain-containing protein [Pseudomonas nitroreducens]
MSTVIMSQCWPLQGMSAPQKAVLISLADNANDEGVCWPSVAKVAERTCLSERAVRNAIRWLEESKILTSHQRHGRSSWYTVTPASYAPGTACPPAPDADLPRHDVPPTPAPGAPITVIEPSVEPSVAADAAADTPKRKAACPAQAIINLFNEILPELPQVVILSNDRRAKLSGRWNDSPVHQNLDFWRDYFGTVRNSAFLMGKTLDRNGKAFRCNFDWLICPSNFVKVVEGNYA